MLRKLTRALFGKSDDATLSGKRTAAESGHHPSAPQGLALDKGVRIIARADHNISRKHISPNALKVLYRLNDAGYHAFLVGGSVRDLLMGGTPKDFDVSTDATPEEVRDLFRNSRVIGRRFKIVHIRFGREIIEVTTFRAHHKTERTIGDSESRRQIRDLDSAQTESGMILRDNVYGDINEDAVRRDFTINALYYTTRDFLVLDFADGIQDLDDGLIRMIGDPETRFREDPVRLLRAIRFAAKLDFDIEASTREPINRLANLLDSISPARLFDETLKLLIGGEAEATYQLMRQYRIGNHLFPATMATTSEVDTPASRLVVLAMRNTDQRLADGKSITPAFLYAALLWPPLQQSLVELCGNQRPTAPQLQQCASEVVSAQLDHTAIPRRFTSMMREIWELQYRLQPTNRRRVLATMAHPRFRAAYDFLLLREEAGEELDNIGDWWTRFQDTDQSGQESMLQQLATRSSTASPRKRRRRPRRSPGGAASTNQPPTGGAS
jgi:poly(A) polymerase